MILILAIFFIYFLLFQFVIASTTKSRGIKSVIEGLSATISTAIVIAVMLIPLFIVILIGLYFNPTFIPTIPLFTLGQILFLFSSTLFLYEVTFERIVIRIIKRFTTSNIPFVLLLLQFFINMYVLSFSISYFTPQSPWPALTVVIISGIDAWINFFFDEITD